MWNANSSPPQWNVIFPVPFGEHVGNLWLLAAARYPRGHWQYPRLVAYYLKKWKYDVIHKTSFYIVLHCRQRKIIKTRPRAICYENCMKFGHQVFLRYARRQTECRYTDTRQTNTHTILHVSLWEKVKMWNSELSFSCDNRQGLVFDVKMCREVKHVFKNFMLVHCTQNTQFRH